jgi:multiple sugar transport system ATP-binding protein
MVFQSYALYPHLSVRKNISFGMEINRVPRAERDKRVEEAARALQLEPLLDRLPAQLSGGQRQRVAIGRCLVREPDLFLFDEPLSNLDAKLRHDTRVELKHLHQRLKATTVYVTHDQHEAMTLATMVVLLKDGEIVQIASPTELYARPINRFAATFIGSPAINLIKGELSADGRFRGGGLDVALPPGVLDGVPSARTVELGLRSENARVAGAADAQQVIEVDYVEPTGADLFVNGRAGGQEVVARVERTAKVAAGDTLPVRWQLDAALVFDAETGTRL